MRRHDLSTRALLPQEMNAQEQEYKLSIAQSSQGKQSMQIFYGYGSRKSLPFYNPSSLTRSISQTIAQYRLFIDLE